MTVLRIPNSDAVGVPTGDPRSTAGKLWGQVFVLTDTVQLNEGPDRIGAGAIFNCELLVHPELLSAIDAQIIPQVFRFVNSVGQQEQ